MPNLGALRIEEMLNGGCWVVLCDMAGVAEQGVHRVHVQPQFFREKKTKTLLKFSLFDCYATVHPQFLALCAIPAWYQLATEMVEQRPIYFQQD